MPVSTLKKNKVKKIQGAILDIDGTLIDSNGAHASAFERAFQESGFIIPYEKIRELIGQGGKELVYHLTGLGEKELLSKEIIKRQGDYFRRYYFQNLKVFPQAKDLVVRMKKEKMKLVIGSSASKKSLSLLLEKIGISDLVDAATSASDVKHAKPCPDIVQVSLKKLRLPPPSVLMLGDTPYDIQAARKASVETVALRCGGWKDRFLKEALAIYDDPKDLLSRFNSSPFTR